MSGGVIHGGVTEAELNAAAARGIELIDLSASLNPYGPHPRVLAAATGAPVGRYPEADASTGRAAYAAHRGLPPGQVLAGNGTSELIYLLARAFGDGRACLVPGPTFGEYEAAAQAAGSPVSAPRWFEPGGRNTGIAALLAAVNEAQPSLVFLCNPNNPTGNLVPACEIEQLTAAVAVHGGRLVVDEAYMDFAWPEDEAVGPAPGRLVLRSLTKLHTIPGLRAGFLLGTEEDIERVARHQPPWALSAPASAAALQALREDGFARESRQCISSTRAALSDALTAAGLGVHPSLANFLLVEVGQAAPFRERLLGRGFVVRDCTSFGLPSYVRIAIPRHEHLQALVTAIREGS